MRVPPMSPAARVLTEAEEVNGHLGHENLGPLSAARGFLPARAPSLALPETHAPWDEVAARLPVLVRDVALRRVLDRMPVLPAGREALAGAALQRAATVLGLLGHACVHLSGPAAPGLPDSIALPWAEVRRRLHRSPEPVLAYTDLITNNWRFAGAADTAPVTVGHLRLLVPTVDNEEERVFYLTQVEILARCAPVVTAVTAAQQAVLDDDPDAVRHALDDVAAVLRTVTRRSLPLIDPRPGSPTHVDPVVWAKTVAPLAVPFRAGVLGPSGTASPVFNLLDAFLGRRGHASQLGAEIRLHRRNYPVSWRRFLAAVEEVSVPDHIAARPSPDLVAALVGAREAYAGLEGFLGRHRRKVSGYLAVAFMVGRGVTIGGFAGSPRERTWHSVDAALTESRLERPCGDEGTPRSHPAAATPRGTAVPAAVRAGVGVADLAEHNDDEHGWWLAVEGRVHDVTGFVRRHPGGVAVLHAHAGLDATVAFGRAHVDRPGLRRLLRATDVGPLRRLDAVGADGLSTAWVAALSAVVHLQNALRLDRSLARGTDLCLADGTPASAFQVDRAADTCARFEGQYLPQVATEVLQPLADHVDPSRGNRPPTPTGTARAAVGGPTAGWRARLDLLDLRLALMKELLCAGARLLDPGSDRAPAAGDLPGLIEQAIAACGSIPAAAEHADDPRVETSDREDGDGRTPGAVRVRR